MPLHHVRSTPARAENLFFVGVLQGDLGAVARTLDQVTEGERHPLQRRPKVRRLALRALHHTNCGCHIEDPYREEVCNGTARARANRRASVRFCSTAPVPLRVRPRSITQSTNTSIATLTAARIIP